MNAEEYAAVVRVARLFYDEAHEALRNERSAEACEAAQNSIFNAVNKLAHYSDEPEAHRLLERWGEEVFQVG